MKDKEKTRDLADKREDGERSREKKPKERKEEREERLPVGKVLMK